MFNTFFTPTAESIPFSSAANGLGALNIQEAMTKLAFLTQASNLLNQDGDIVLRIGASATSVVLPSPVGRWKITATDDGEIVSELLQQDAPDIVTYWRFKRSDGSIAAIEIDEDGEVIMLNPPDTTGVDIATVFLGSPSGYIFALSVSDDGEFITGTASNPFPSFKIVNQTDQVMFSTVQQNDLALNYMPVYDVATLPLNPLGINNTMPWVFVKNGAMQKPAYFDGLVWRYFNTDGLVIPDGA
jgi:hypothetical protein